MRFVPVVSSGSGFALGHASAPKGCLFACGVLAPTAMAVQDVDKELADLGADVEEEDSGDDQDKVEEDEFAEEPQAKRGKTGCDRKKILNEFGKTRSRTTKDGKKFCAPCGRWLPVEEFPPGSGQCGEDRKAIQNLRNAAAAQGQSDWWEEACCNPAKLKKVVAAYSLQDSRAAAG